MKINDNKTELIVDGETHKLNDIEIICTQGESWLTICKQNGSVKTLYKDAPKEFRKIASLFILNKLDNFVLTITGNNVININKVKNLAYNGMELNIQTNNYTKTIFNVSGLEYLYLKDKLNQTQQKQDGGVVK